MGKGRDKKKKKRDENVTAKNKEKEEAKKLKKLAKKRGDASDQEDDIDALLLAFQKEQQEKFNVTEQKQSEPPSRRANASMCTNPLNPLEIILFGGEYYDGSKVHMFNDLFRYHIEKNEWTRITSPNSPGPRSSHQMVATATGLVFLFGGEFVSPNETSFFHYKDFWCFDLKTNEWEKIDLKTKPGPRSGHRMTMHKHYIVLFGGFYDSCAETKYYDDLWIFDTLNYNWTLCNVAEPRPSPRSGFQFFSHGDNCILFGGYSKIYQKGKKVKGFVHQDMWTLKLSNELKSIQWEKKRKAGGFIPCARCGCTMTSYKGKGILLGGVTDIEESDETIDSICHGDAYQYQIETHKWYPLNLRIPKKKMVKESEIQQENIQPCPRFNCMMTCAKNQLIVFGGILEHGSREITLNDLWILSLDKMDQWKCVLKDDFLTSEWLGEDSDDDVDDEQESECSDSSDISDEENDQNVQCNEQQTNSIEASEEDVHVQLESTHLVESDIQVDDPLPNETLRDYFLRTCKMIFFNNSYEYIAADWQCVAIELFELEQSGKGGKGLRKDAFQMAQTRFHQMQPLLEKMKETLEEQEALLVKKPKEVLRNRDR